MNKSVSPNHPKKVKVQYLRRSLPVLRTGDVVIAGGSFAGVAAALEFARADRKVVLVEPRTYLGREMTATLRPWVSVGAFPVPDMILDLFRPTGRKRRRKAPTEELPLQLDVVKLGLEDALIEAGVELLYASAPVGIVRNAVGRVCGLIIGNKSGRQVLQGQMIVDATATATVARAAGVPFESETTLPARYRRTLEFDDIGATPQTVFHIPDEIGVSGNIAHTHRGYRGLGHLYLEFELDLPSEGTGLEAMMHREIEARHRSMRLASYLLLNELPFTQRFDVDLKAAQVALVEDVG